MIECPICRVMNEDMARFCAECGQRLSAPSGPAQPQQAPQPRSGPGGDVQGKPGKPAGAKLHSPLLGGDLSGGEPDEPKADFSRLRGGPGRASNDRGADSGQGGGKGLRSPLLGGGGGEPEPYSEPEHSSGRPKRGGLKSPLLGGGSDFEPEYDEPQRGGGGQPRGLRSPLLGGSDAGGGYEDLEPPKSGRGLRSPLLGGEPEYNQPAQPRSAGGGSGSRPGSLRSPLLGGTDAYGGGGYEPEPEIEDNPNVLRSPLLASKVPMSERPAKPAAQPPQPQMQPPQPPAQPQMHQPAHQGPSPSVNEGMLDAFTGRPQQPGQAPGYTPGYAPAQPTPIVHAHGQAPAPMPQQATSPANQVPPINTQAAQPSSAFAPQPSAPIVHQQAPAQPHAQGLAAGSQGMASAFSGAPSAGAPERQPAPAPSPFDNAPAAPSRYAPEPAPQPEPERPAPMPRAGRGKAALDEPEEDARPRKRMPSRMISGDEPEPFEAPAGGGRFAAPPAAAPAGNPIAKLLIIPLIGCLLEKGYVFTQVGGNQLYLIDTVANMVLIVSLIILCATSGGGRR